MKLKKKIYITGVSGFIGSSLAKKCLESGHSVIGITRNSASEISKQLKIKVIEADLLKEANLEIENADVVIHCATANDILSKNINEGYSLSINGTSNLLEASKRANISNFIFFSTAQVYGTELKGCINESTALNCKTTYGLNHYLGEELCKFYSDNHDFNSIVLRPSNVYGVPELNTVNRKTLVPMCFIEEAVKHGSITLRSSGKQMRNFISTDELGDIVLKILNDIPKGFSKINCGSNFNSSILDIAKIVANCYEKNLGKKLIIDIEKNEPKISNIFEYNSNFSLSLPNKNISMKNIETTINRLLQKYKSN